MIHISKNTSKKEENRPEQYKRGFVEFYKINFKVKEGVLIPRPETELLVDEVLKFIKSSDKKVTVLDIGTGAGTIAISIAKNSKDIKIIATEISEEALIIAKENAKLNGVLDKIEFILSDLLEDIDSKLFLPDSNLVVVTNLPYIPSERINYLDSSVKDFEPHIALDGGADGFELYRDLFFQIKNKNFMPKLIVGEIDYTHGEIARHAADKFFPNSETEVKLDLYHRQRILVIKSY